MHKIKYGPGNKGVWEYKEKCPNPDCKQGTIWVYPASFRSPICSDCKTTLNGKNLMLHEIDRVTHYHAK